jgi:hypothetical protein
MEEEYSHHPLLESFERLEMEEEYSHPTSLAAYEPVMVVVMTHCKPMKVQMLVALLYP